MRLGNRMCLRFSHSKDKNGGCFVGKARKTSPRLPLTRVSPRDSLQVEFYV
jgi:hypothetical protein